MNSRDSASVAYLGFDQHTQGGAMRAWLETLLFKRLTGLTSRVRVAFYRALGARIGPGTRLERVRCRRLTQISIGAENAFTEGCWLWPRDASYPGTRIRIGDRNYFNRDVMIDACGLIEIGDDNMFGPGVYLTDSNHTSPIDGRVGDSPMSVGHVRIGNGCWLGARATILKGVELGDHCVVGAGAVVTKSFPAHSVLIGVPAVPIQREG